MRARDAVIGFVFLVILIAGVIWVVRNRNLKNSNIPLPSPSIEARIRDTFPNLIIPTGAERATLNDVSGGTSLGVATRTEVVANLPQPTSGQTYQASLVNGDGKSIILGNMHIAKSGWIVSYDATKYPGYNKVVVSSNGKNILEGSF